MGGGPGVVVSTAAFHARVRCSVPGLGGLKETKMFLPHPRVKVSIVGSLCDREVVCSASNRQRSNPVSGGQCHLNHLTILRRFSWPSLARFISFYLYVHKGGITPESSHFLVLYVYAMFMKFSLFEDVYKYISLLQENAYSLF